MQLLLPPSEGKNSDLSGTPLALSTLSFPQLNPARQRVLEALVRLSRGRERRALDILGLSAGQADELILNRELCTSDTAPARAVYTGVLFAALQLAELAPTDLARANDRILITSSVFGFVAPHDQICSYRLAGSVNLPKLGKVSAFWRTQLTKYLPGQLTDQLVVDFRSGTYVNFWPIPKDRSSPALTVKIWQHGPNGARTAVSHHNKSAKGALARLLATVDQAHESIDEVVDCARSAGWDATLEPNPSQGHCRLDVVIA